MFSYKPLLKLLIDRDMKITDLGLSSATRAKINKNDYLSMDVLDRICSRLSCRIEEIMEHVPDEHKKDPREQPGDGEGSGAGNDIS